MMLNKKVTVPENFREKNCCLVSYEMPFLKHCFVLCSNYEKSNNSLPDEELVSLFLNEAKILALQHANDKNAFVYCFSGSSIRKRYNFHIHVFIVSKRWEKALVYSLIATKNWGQVLKESLYPKNK